MKAFRLFATAGLVHALFICSFSQAPVSYNDVLVVANSNSSISTSVANYFKTQRGIPNLNICTLAMPTTDQIDSVQFLTIANQIKSFMSSNGLTNSINYIVTTQGVPLKVRRSGSVFDLFANSSSFDGDLALINSTLEAQIGNPGRVINPYRNATARFTRSASYSNIYLVTRLAGYSYNDIVGVIDRARQPYLSHGQFVLDVDPSRGLTNTYNLLMKIARDTLINRGFSVLYDESSEFIVGKNNVLGYASWGSNDPMSYSYAWKAQPRFTWSPKALAETFVSTSGRTFSDSTFIEPTTGWQSLVADLIHENGVTGVKGYVWEPWLSSCAKPDLLFARWVQGFNLAESYSVASNNIGWMDVIVGDPKATLVGDGHLPVQLVSFSGSYLGNRIKLTWATATETNNFGFEVEKKSGSDWTVLGFVNGGGTSNVTLRYDFVDESPASRNIYRLKQIDRDGSIEYSGILEVMAEPKSGFVLNQNYPNPVMHTTSIPFTLGRESHVTAEIITLDGRVVTKLINNDKRQPGQHTVIWDGRGADNARVPGGTYLCRVSISENGNGGESRISRITVL